MIELEEYTKRICIDLSRLMERTRLPNIVAARQVYWFYLHENGHTLQGIGRMFNMHHTTVYHGIRKTRDLISVNDAYLKRFLEAIEYHE